MNNIRRTKTSNFSLETLIPFRLSANTSFLILSLCFLAACSSSPPQRPPVSSNDVLKSERKGNIDSSSLIVTPSNDVKQNNFQAESYLNKAKTRSIQEQSPLLLRAAEFFFAANNPRDARAALNKVEITTLSQQEQAQYTILRSKGLTQNLRHADSLSLLENIDKSNIVTKKYRAEYYSLQAQNQFALGNLSESMIALLDRENFLERDEIGDNQQRLWAILDASTPSQIAQIRQNTDNQALADWLDLATLANYARTTSNPNLEYSEQLRSDEFAHSTPLSEKSLSNIPSLWTSNSPQKIALLLPINSTFGNAAKAFESGFRQASRDNNTPFRPNVATYDLGSSPQAFQQINSATQDGADFIVGPLGKAAAQSVLDVASPSIPVMALGGVINRPSPLMSLFTLSPEQEMAAISRHALNRGFSNAAILYPNSAWGERNRVAFRQAWTSANGSIVGEQVYQAESYDHSATIKTLLAINASSARHNRLSSTLGFKPKFTPARRGDVDFLILIARNTTARVIKPQLSFYQAHDLPVYSTSAVYNGIADPANDADLDGLMFPEMPWLLSDTNNSNASSSRLFAFGYDAYQLIPILTQMRLSDGLSYEGLTGRLVANSNGQIERHPAFAKFKNGIAEIDGESNRSPRYQVASPSFNDTNKVINRSNHYDSKNWDERTNSRK